MLFDNSNDSLHPRSEAFSLAKCLHAVGVPGATATPLAGGMANYIWRLVDQSGQKHILKHAEASLKYNAAIESSAERLFYEFRALQMPALRAACMKVPTVRAPVVRAFDHEHYALLMTDGGGRSLAAAYEDGDRIDFVDLGARLASWTAALHNSTRSAAASDFPNPVSDRDWMSAAKEIPDYLVQHGFERQDGVIVRDEYYGLNADEQTCCVHGDLRPGNMLLMPRNDVMIIDWEDSRLHSPAMDLGIFAAHSHILESACGDRGLLQAFLTTYRAAAGTLVDERVALRTATEYGVFLAYWTPQLNLCDKAQSIQFAAVGAEMLHKAVHRDFEWLRQSCLRALF